MCDGCVETSCISTSAQHASANLHRHHSAATPRALETMRSDGNGPHGGRDVPA